MNRSTESPGAHPAFGAWVGGLAGAGWVLSLMVAGLLGHGLGSELDADWQRLAVGLPTAVAGAFVGSHTARRMGKGLTSGRPARVVTTLLGTALGALAGAATMGVQLIILYSIGSLIGAIRFPEKALGEIAIVAGAYGAVVGAAIGTVLGSAFGLLVTLYQRRSAISAAPAPE
jgi:hypothetical protein